MNFMLDGEESDRIKFRLVQETDYDQWLPFFQNPETSLHWIEPTETSEIACSKWIQKQFFRYENNLGGMNALLDKQSGKLMGYCGLLVQTVDQIQEVEIAYSLLPKFWNKGLASEAAQKCRDFGFNSRLNNSLISIISITNIPSERVAIKNGMVWCKTTVYKENKVNIFRIDINHWQQRKS
jgi:RimJ/RimL family protein N-acetyltransferase